jgi:hypothetical protein
MDIDSRSEAEWRQVLEAANRAARIASDKLHNAFLVIQQKAPPELIAEVEAIIQAPDVTRTEPGPGGPPRPRR